MAKGVGERLRERRRELELTQVQLAKAAGIGQGALSAIETGETTILRAETLLGLAKALGVDPEWLQTGVASQPDVADADFRDLLRRLDMGNRRRLLALGLALLGEQTTRRLPAGEPPALVQKPAARTRSKAVR